MQRLLFVILAAWALAAVVLTITYANAFAAPFALGAFTPDALLAASKSRTLLSALLAMALASPVVLIGTLLVAFRDPRNKPVLLTLIGVLAATPFMALVAARFLTEPSRQHAFAAVEENARPLVQALVRYIEKNGAAPATLDQFVPVELAALPSPGLAGYDAFAYQAFAGSSRSRTLVWYDLGPRKGRSDQRLWIYPDGNADHALLACELDGGNKVDKCFADRMPTERRDEPWSPEAWEQRRAFRWLLVPSLAREGGLVGATREALVAKLGPPDGERALIDTPWELSVVFSRSDDGDERLFYWPTGHYPTVLDRAIVSRVGTWAYARP